MNTAPWKIILGRHSQLPNRHRMRRRPTRLVDVEALLCKWYVVFYTISYTIF